MNALIENLFYFENQGFQFGCFEYQDPIAEWLETSYQTSSLTNNKFQSFLMFEKTENMIEYTFVSSLKGLYDRHFN